MLAKALQTRAMARLAVAALALGLFALAGLALWSTDRTERDAVRLGEINDIAAKWGSLFEALNVQDAALGDYLNAGDEVGRQPLLSALHLGTPELAWLEQHCAPSAKGEVAAVAEAYGSYTATLAGIIDLGRRGEQGKVMLQAKAASLLADTLRKQLTANIAHQRLEITAYLLKAKRLNRQMKAAGVAIFAVDTALLLLCSVVLLGYQRRVERQAAESGYRALHDALTGLPNRSLLNKRLEEAVLATGSAGDPVALLLIDLDRFKEVNDTVGHHFGDLLLQTVAARLVGTVRSGDTVARLGGDEFAVLMPAVTGVGEADRLARVLLRALQQPAELEGITVDVGGSIGLALYPTHSQDARQLLQHADIAMYAAKRGHLGTAIYSPNEDRNSIRNLTLLGDLRRALDRGEILLHYQPKIYTEHDSVCGVEAFVRWQHPDHGLLLPEEFVPLAEESVLMERLFRYILTAALDQCRRWQAVGRQLPVSINVAPGCLLDPVFPDLVAGLLVDRRLPANLLTLEFTESALLTASAGALDVVRRLRDGGVRVCVDGFGANHSSLDHLRTMPIHELKIHPVLTARLGNDEPSRAKASEIVQFARELNLQVVAEGVEDEAGWIALGDLGCDIGQGNWLGTPRHADDITRWLAGLDGASTQHIDRTDRGGGRWSLHDADVARINDLQAMREAYHDSVTGLPNRALFLDRLNQALAASSRTDDEVIVLFIDLDHFKEVNDSFGHSAGDALLADVANRIRGCLGSADTAARLGGDEFAVILPATATAAGVAMGERVVGAVREPFRIASRDVFVGASVGVASSRTSCAGAAELLSNADIAMHHAKKSASGQTAVFEPAMQSAVLHRLELHSDLQHALARSELSLQFQPLFRLDSAQPVGAEALLRWTHPTRGGVSPVEFIPIAEDTGLIVEIGRWVLWQSAHQAVEWQRAVPEVTVNVNVSGRQIADARFVADVADVLSASGLPAPLLTLELTESVIMNDPDNVLPRLRHLKSMGVRLSVDDFGTGYSSLAYLCQFPVDELKIDRSFVAGMAAGPTNLAVVRTIIELAHTLKLQTVAEGIEDGNQLQTLRRLGGDFGQGYYLARPLGPDEVYAFLTRNAASTA
jgi:diguanylate cyclase (GGDEF)-like protein